MRARRAPSRRPVAISARKASSISSTSTQSTIAIGSAPTQTMSFAFMATQSMPAVSNLPSAWATSAFVPIVSVARASASGPPVSMTVA